MRPRAKRRAGRGAAGGGRSRAGGSRALGSAGDATQGTVGAPRGADRADGAPARAARRARGAERGGGRSAGTAALLEWRLRRDVPAGSAFHLPQPGAPSGTGLELDEAQLQGDRRVPSLFVRATSLCACYCAVLGARVQAFAVDGVVCMAPPATTRAPSSDSSLRRVRERVWDAACPISTG